jgi:hypothetical protein
MEIQWITKKMKQAQGLNVQDFAFNKGAIIQEHFIGINGFNFQCSGSYSTKLRSMGITTEVVSQPASNIITVSCNQTFDTNGKDYLDPESSWVWVTVVAAISSKEVSESLNFRNVFNMSEDASPTINLGQNISGSLSCLRSFSANFNGDEEINSIQAETSSTPNATKLTVNSKFELKEKDSNIAQCNNLNASAISTFSDTPGFELRTVTVDSGSGSSTATSNSSNETEKFGFIAEKENVLALICAFEISFSDTTHDPIRSIIAGNLKYDSTTAVYSDPENSIEITNTNKEYKAKIYSNASMHSQYKEQYGGQGYIRTVDVYSTTNTVKYLVLAKK